jgi:hypothetical protein
MGLPARQGKRRYTSWASCPACVQAVATLRHHVHCTRTRRPPSAPAAALVGGQAQPEGEMSGARARKGAREQQHTQHARELRSDSTTTLHVRGGPPSASFALLAHAVAYNFGVLTSSALRSTVSCLFAVTRTGDTPAGPRQQERSARSRARGPAEQAAELAGEGTGAAPASSPACGHRRRLPSGRLRRLGSRACACT